MRHEIAQRPRNLPDDRELVDSPPQRPRNRRGLGSQQPVSTHSAHALAAFADLNEILGLELKIKKPQRSKRLELLRETERFLVVEGVCQAHLSLSPGRVQKLTDEISRTLQQKEAFLAQTQKLVGRLDFAETSVMGRAERVALRPRYDLVMRGGGKLDTRSEWALTW